MVIYLPGQSADEEPILDELTPREIVRELDKHVVGQSEAKRAVAIALRNRIRRQKLPPEMADEVMPKNILMIGSTGVGKTELARRLARLANSPFLKVEASKFTEVGYVGRDVESMIRDLVDISIDMVREERLDEVADRAELSAEDRLLDILMPQSPEPTESVERSREKLRERLREGKLDERIVEIDVKDRAPTFEISANASIEEMGINLKDMLPNIFGQKSRRRKMRVAEALDYLVQEVEQKLRAWPWNGWKPAASSSWTRSTRSPGARAGTARTSAARACSATSCPSSKAPPSTRATASCAPITSCSSPPAHSTSPNPAT
jgi:ATP-dependent HslUV protease ATP-binding subunit HslU